MSTNFKWDIFLSHSNHDKTQVRRLAQDLKDRNLGVWLDNWEIKPGGHILTSVEEGLEYSHKLVLCLSKSAVTSDWVNRELSAILFKDPLNKENRYIPVLLEECQIPASLQAFSHVDLNNDPNGFEKLVEACQPATQFSSDETRIVSKKLEDYLKQEEELCCDGQCTNNIRQKILQCRRKLREGSQLEPGDILDNRYTLKNKIGSGGFAIVWKAWDRQTRTVVAVKVLHGQWAKDKHRIERFFRGARQMKKLNHSGIVRVLDEKVRDSSYYFFVMEYLTGGHLRDFGKKNNLTTKQIIELILQIGDAISHTHKHKMVHRDVKPLNILLDAKGQVKLADFDLVRAADTTGGTRTGAMGTFVYSAPESLENAKDADHRADIYSLGMTAFFLFHGKDIPGSVIYALKQFCNKVDCSQAIKEILLKAIAIDPENRYQTVEEFCSELQKSLKFLSTNNRPAPWVRIEPGEFLMGSPDDEPGRWDYEGPVHKVRITRPFLLKSTPVTQGEWQALMGNNPSYFKGGGDECPVEQINWWEALAFCNALSLREGFEPCYELKISNDKKPGENMECESATFKGLDCTGYRLPTEAEWEYAVRAGTNTALYTGNITIVGENNAPELDEIAWYGGNSGVSYKGSLDSSGWPEMQFPTNKSGTHPVGQKKQNSWGLYDMLGNVWEWTWDRYENYGKNTVNDPVGHYRSVYRVIRGGGFDGYARYCRSAIRRNRPPGYRGHVLGFRVARTALGS